MHACLLPRRSAGVFRGFALALLAAGFAFPAQAADTQPPAATPAGDEIVRLSEFQVTTTADKGYRAGNSVSATRIDTPIRDLPFSVSAFTEQFIVDIGARDLIDIVKYAPGVTSSAREFNAGNTRYNIRGFDQMMPQRNGFVGTAYIDTVNVQRVEIVKGPASILYGQIQPGGTVNVITKVPGTKRFGAFNQQVGTDSFWRTALDLNAPSAGETILCRVNASWENGSEWIEPSRTRTWVISPTVVWKITPKSSLMVDYQWFRRNEDPPVFMKPNIRIAGLATAYTSPDGKTFTPIDYGFGPFYPLPPEFNYPARQDYRDADFESVYAEYTIKLSDHWSARANYNWSHRAVKNKLTGIADARMYPNGVNLTTTGTGYSVLGGTPSVAAGTGVTTITGTYGSFSFNPNDGSVTNNLRTGAWALLPRRARLQEEFGQGNAYQAEIAGKYRWANAGWKPLVGAFFNYTRGRGRMREQGDFYLPWNLLDRSTWVDQPSPNGRASPALRPDGTYDVAALPQTQSSVTFGRDIAYYTAQSLSLLDDRLMLMGGARYNRVRSRGDNLRVEPNPDTVAGRNEIRNNGWSSVSRTIYQAGGGCRIVRPLMVYASYSESFVVDTRFLQFRSEQDRPAQPSSAEGKEAGLKADFQDGRISVTAAVFEINQFDRVLNFSERVGTQSLTTQLQDTEDRSKGWEVEATISPRDNWQVYVSYADIDVKLTSVPVGLEPLLGARPEASVRHVFNLWTRYTVADGALKGVWLGAGANYTGDKAQRVDNRLLTMPAYTLYDVTLGYDWKWRDRPVGATLAWKNVTDEEYFPANQQRGLPSRAILSFSTRF